MTHTVNKGTSVGLLTIAVVGFLSGQARSEPVSPLDQQAVHSAQRGKSSIWFTADTALGGRNYHTVFIASQRNGDCHACAATIDAITYPLSDGRQAGKPIIDMAMAKVGDYGRPPVNDLKAPYYSPHRVTVTTLTPNASHAMLLIEGGSEGQGEADTYRSVLGFDGTRWNDLGTLQTGLDDQGGPCSVPAEHRVCTIWSGTVSALPSATPWPALDVAIHVTSGDVQPHTAHVRYELQSKTYRAVSGPAWAHF